MDNVLRLAIVDPDDTTREQLKNTLLGMDIVWLEAECSRYDFFADVVAQTGPEIVLVALDSDPDRALELVAELPAISPDCNILVISGSSDGDLILRSMRAGAKEFLTRPLGLEDLVEALGRIKSQRGAKGDSKARGTTVLAVSGATGGVGTTSVAVNLGCSLARHPQNSVCLVDLDLSLGDADVFLDTIPDFTLADVAQNVSRLDFSLLKRSLTAHSSGLFLLPRPVEVDDAEIVSAEALQRVIGLLKATFTHVILDLSKSYTAIDRMAIEMCDQMLLVTQLDLPCMRNVVRLMVTFGEIAGTLEKTKVVVNRFGLDDGQISLKKAEDTMGREVFAKLPNDYRTMVDVRNNGVPLVTHAPKSRLCHAVNHLADSLAGIEPEESASSDPKAALSRMIGSFWTKSGGQSSGKQQAADQ